MRDARAVFPRAGVGGLESWQTVNISIPEVLNVPKIAVRASFNLELRKIIPNEYVM